MKDFIDSLAILTASPKPTTHRAALHLIAAEVIKSNPIPPPAVCDAQMVALLAATVDCPRCGRLVIPVNALGNVYCSTCGRWLQEGSKR